MKVNIENCVNQMYYGQKNLIDMADERGGDHSVSLSEMMLDGANGGRAYVIKEMVENLKELRDRTSKGDLSVLDEFFNLYLFNDDKKYHRDPKEEVENDEINKLSQSLDNLRTVLANLGKIRIIFSPEKGEDGSTTLNFVEVEDGDGNSINIGNMSNDGDYLVLTLDNIADLYCIENDDFVSQSASIAMLRNYLEKIVESDNLDMCPVSELREDIVSLLKATDGAECLKMWEDTQEQLIRAQRQRDQYVKAHGEVCESLNKLKKINNQRVEALNDIKRLQCSDGNWNNDPYMHGMANGFIMASAIFEGVDPVFLESPCEWKKKEGILMIERERRRQKEKGYSDIHDSKHEFCELAIVAAQLAADGTDATVDDPHDLDSWGLVSKHGYRASSPDRIHALSIAGALIAAEIDRIMPEEEKPVMEEKGPIDTND